MNQLNLLIFLSFAMLIGSFLAGTIPMAFRLSDSKSRLLALLGSGILVGTALAIIIPEGIDSLYSSQQQLQTSTETHNSMNHQPQPPNNDPISQSAKTLIVGISLVVGFVLMFLIDQFSIYQTADRTQDHCSIKMQTHEYSLANQHDDDEDNNDADVNSATIDSRDDDESASIIDNENITKDNDTHKVSMKPFEAHNPMANGHQIENNNGSHILNQPDILTKEHNYHSSQPQVKITRRKSTKVTPTLGLVIHAAADGIALGAAATTAHREVEMIIFLAIMLHKGPAAFSLVVFLLHRGINHSTIRRHLLAFSLSAPLAALITYFGLSQSGKEALRQNNATGIAMLFSAGTFLYVATVHVLPELVHNKLLTPKEQLFLIGGVFLPVLLAQTV